MPPTNVYNATPTGNKNVAATTCIPVIAGIAADAPKSMFAQAIMLFTRHKNIKTICATLPYRIRIISRRV
jgi:hypothetical protein